MTRAFVTSALLATLASCFVSCAPAPPLVAMPYREPDTHLFEWYDDGGPGNVAIKINLSTQRATYMRGNRQIGWSYVTTGKEGHGTPAGRYPITEKIVDKYSNAYGWIEDDMGNVVNNDATPKTEVPPGCRYVPAPMPYWMRLTNRGIGLHAGIIPSPGEPVSHGCIRLPKPLAPLVFGSVKVGTPVTIVYGNG